MGDTADQTEDRLGERSEPESKNFRQAGIVELKSNKCRAEDGKEERLSWARSL